MELYGQKSQYRFRVIFLLRVPNVVAENPELKDKSPFKEILAKNFTTLKDMTEKEAMDLIATTHSNISEIEFDNLVKKGLKMPLIQKQKDSL